MTHKIIKTDNYLLVVDEKADLIGLDRKPVVTYHKVTESPILDFFYEEDLAYYKFKPSKIIAHLPLNNAPVLAGVDLLPMWESIKFHYSEEDIINVAKFATGTYRTEKEIKSYIQSLQQPVMPVGFKAEMETTIIKQSQCVNMCASFPSQCLCEMTKETKIKTIPNKQGIPVWQGEYIYKT